MSNTHGSFIWYQLMSRDPDASKAFYEDVVGWKIGPPPPGEMDYRMIEAADGNVGGVLAVTSGMMANGARPMWLGYLGVDSVDGSVQEIIAAGGAVLVPAWDIPDVGRIAMVADPQGTPFFVMHAAGEATSTAFGRTALGHISWNELLTPDQDAALAFYGTLFGMSRAGVMPMGPLGDYTFLQHDGAGIGAMMTTPPEAPSGWGFYFRVPEIEAAKERVVHGGGTVTQGPMEVPGGEMVLSAIDPQGATFGLVAPGKSA